VASFGKNVEFYITRNQFSSYLMKNIPVHADELREMIIEISESENDVNTFLEDDVHEKIFANEMERIESNNRD
ncbi:MAG TPA: hypothetical protein VLO12_12085, partial [Halomonas sp.]|nr:hypothetical protein [Halomonas sp.]